MVWRRISLASWGRPRAGADRRQVAQCDPVAGDALQDQVEARRGLLVSAFAKDEDGFLHHGLEVLGKIAGLRLPVDLGRDGLDLAQLLAVPERHGLVGLDDTGRTQGVEELEAVLGGADGQGHKAQDDGGGAPLLGGPRVGPGP